MGILAPAVALALASCTAPPTPAAPAAPVASDGPAASPGPAVPAEPGSSPTVTSGGPMGTPLAPSDPLPEPGAAASPAPPGGAALPGLPDRPTSPERPVPKVQRGGAASEPEISAAPVATREQLAYPDGVKLAIVDVSFTEEKGEGPGRFPGRQLALLSLEARNGSTTQVSLDTVVVTVLDPAGNALPPVYLEGSDVRDFAGALAPGATAAARYGFAVPKEARSSITVVVDFDGAHTSAVFRGPLG